MELDFCVEVSFKVAFLVTGGDGENDKTPHWAEVKGSGEEQIWRERVCRSSLGNARCICLELPHHEAAKAQLEPRKLGQCWRHPEPSQTLAELVKERKKMTEDHIGGSLCDVRNLWGKERRNG